MWLFFWSMYYVLYLSEGSKGFSGGSSVKNLPANEETQETRTMLSLGGEDPLEKEMAIHSNIPA